MNWDPFQRAVLAELGHALYRPAGQALPEAGASDGGDMPADVAATRVAHANVVSPDDALLARLARAAACEPADLLRYADIAAALATLRGDARAKRALWPRLRALRRG